MLCFLRLVLVLVVDVWGWSWICKRDFVFLFLGILQLFWMNDCLRHANGDERGILFAVPSSAQSPSLI